MKIGLKLTLTFFLVACVSMLVIGFIAYNKGKAALEQESFNRLTVVREMKSNQIEDYFGQIKDQILTLSEDPAIIRAMNRFRNGFDSIAIHLEITDEKMAAVDSSVDKYFATEYLPRLNRNLEKPATLAEESTTNKNGRILQDLYIASNPNETGFKSKLDDANDGSGYSKAHKRLHPVIRSYQKKFGYYDIFLVDDKTGNIVYSCFKEADFGTSLTDGPFRNTNLAAAFRAAQHLAKKDSVSIVDYQPYHPSYNAPASFIAAPIIDDGKKIGVIIFQMPIDRINDIMTSKRDWTKVGLGETGETYIVGEDFMLRNQSRFLIEDSTNYFRMIHAIGLPDATISKIRSFNTSIGLQPVKTEGTQAALRGEAGEKIFHDYRGVPVLSSFKPLKIPGMHWVIMSELDEAEAFAHVYTLRRQIILALISLLLVIAVGSLLISRRITRPLTILTEDASELAHGNFHVEIDIKRKDEIGTLALSFRKMQTSISNLVDELRNINQNLEQKVVDRTLEINRQKELVEHQNREILDSINYALRLQQAMLPPKEIFAAALKDSFILFRPKDIVSGDFYWLNRKEDQTLVAAVDCTGHGVPGALVSMVGASSLDRCIGEFGLRRPSDILDKLRQLVIATFESKDHEVKDGMDIALVSIRYHDETKRSATVDFAGANNPLWIKRKDEAEITEIKADKQPIGVWDFGKPFSNHQVSLNAGDCIYLFTDGYADQFGGPVGKKFRYKALKSLLENISQEPMDAQHRVLEETFVRWQGELQQIDDVCLIGIRI